MSYALVYWVTRLDMLTAIITIALILSALVINSVPVDSLTVLDRIDKNASIIDVGTGAGFPGIPIKIAKENR